MTAKLIEIDRGLRFDLLLTAGVGLVAWVSLLITGYGTDLAVLTLLLVLPLVFRRLWPSLALALMTGAALLFLVVSGTPPWGAAIAVPIMVYSLARWSGGRLATLGLLAGLLGSLLGPLTWTGGLYAGNAGVLLVMAVACAGIVLAAYLIGRGRRQTRLNADQQARSRAEQEHLRQAEEEQRTRAGESSERNRIARELHDIVAHSLSVIVVQAEGGRALAAKRPEQAVQTLGTIAETGRNALEEMRRIVGVLRGGEAEPSAYAPLPGLADLDELVRSTSDTAELVSLGQVPEVSPAVGLTVYRIVQESLTNVLKHAGPAARARVTLAYTTDSIEIDVSDDGRGAAAASEPGRGHGLQGMRERVTALDGTLTAQPRPGGGYAVRASLPLAGSRAAA